jgi:hypothetical protein
MKTINMNEACSIIQFQDRAFLPGREVVKNNVLSEDDIMFNDMNGHVVNALVKVGLFHSIPFFFHQTEGSFDSGAERFQSLLVWPEQNGTSAASVNIPFFLSVSGDDEHESQYDMPSSYIPQKPHRPISPWKFRNPEEISIKPHPIDSANLHHGEESVRNRQDQLPSLRRQNALPGSTLPPPNGSKRTILRPESISNPTKSTKSPLCGYRSMPRAVSFAFLNSISPVKEGLRNVSAFIWHLSIFLEGRLSKNKVFVCLLLFSILNKQC